MRRHRIGVAIAVAALSGGLWASGCGFGGGGGGDTTTTAAPPHSIAQILLLQGGGSGLQVLLLKHGHKVFFNPDSWVFPTGSVESRSDGEAAAKAAAVSVLADQGGIEVSPSALVPSAEWKILGFDTRFYMAPAPPKSKPRPDGTQIVAAGWYAPQRALALHYAGRLKMAYGVVKQLDALRGYPSADKALESARDTQVVPVQLRVIGQGDKQRAVLPEDAP